MKEKLEAIQKIGNEICEGCYDDSDCGINPKECSRILSAIDILEEYINKYEKIKNLDK